jgi:8-oxo-dGTP pyrophosphatase MutT (NUDIX family)
LPFRKLAETPLLDTAVIRVASGQFESPEGERFERTLVHHPGAVGVVPLLGDGRVVMVRQYRAAADAELLEIPAGKRDVPGEDPADCAARELEEEIGRRAGRLELLARFYTSVGYSDEHFTLYAGHDLVEVATDLQGLEEQHMSIEVVDLADVGRMIASGELADAKTIIGLTLVIAAGRNG